MPIRVIQHPRIGGLQAGIEPVLVRRMLVPCLDAVIARRHFRIFGDNAEFLLAGKAALAFPVPAAFKHRIIALDDVFRRLMRGMAGGEGAPEKPRVILRAGVVIGQHADGLIDQILRQVIAGFIGAGRVDMAVVAHQLRRILVGLRVEEAVEAVKSPAQGPAVKRSSRAAFIERVHMPFADHIVAIGMGAQHLGERTGRFRDLAAIARMAAVEIRKATDADGMMVPSGQEGRPGGRTHGRRMKAGIADASRGKLVDGRRLDRGAVAAEIGKADIIEENDEDIRRPFRGFWRLGPVGCVLFHFFVSRSLCALSGYCGPLVTSETVRF